MMSSIARGYRKLFSLVGVVLLLVALCLVLGAAIVFPLWKWATSSASYSVAVLVLACAAAAYAIVKKARSDGLRVTARKTVKLLIVAGGIGGALVLLYAGHRAGALGVFVAAFLAYGAAVAIDPGKR